MAPALTQASEPLNLADATRHTSSPFFSKYKCLKLPGSLINGKPFTNGDKFTAGLAPPVFGVSECHSPPAVFGRTMEESPTLPNSESGITEEEISRVQAEYTPPPPILSEMGCHTNSINSPLAGDLAPCNPKARDTPEAIFSVQHNDLLNFMGRDFGNVSEIIDTLQKLASNPELLDAAGRELDSSAQVSGAPAEESMEEKAASMLGKLASRQMQLQRKKEFLLRRLRRVSARGLTAAVSSQLDYLVSKGSKLRLEDDLKSNSRVNAASSSGLSEFHADSLKNMTTSDLVDYVHKMEASQHQRKRNDHLVNTGKPAMPLPEPLCAEADYIVSEMKAATLAQVGHDSDATESSSGGESCDELETFQSTNYKPIRERALYKYCHRRGWIASKWAWLRAQIADFDYKISQQEKVYMQLRNNKGDVTFTEQGCNGGKMRKIVNKLSFNNSKESQLTSSSSPALHFPVNGYHPYAVDEPTSSENSCARTLSVSKLKRRRFIRPSAVLRRNKRSYLGSSLSLSAYREQNKTPACSCVVPLTCVLCTNLQSNSVYNVYGVQFVKTRDLASLVQNRQNIKEKLAKVDPSFHAVLSKKSAMLQSEAYSNSLSTCQFQEKNLSYKEVDDEDEMDEPLNKRRKKDFRDLRRRKRDGLRLNIENRKYNQDLITEEDSWEIPSPPHQDLCIEKKDKLRSEMNQDRSKKITNSHKKNNNANSYDIDNIVIPQSMATISLVETLPYKEIMTPKWRICELSPISCPSLNDSDEIEDISEETFKARHAISEDKERKYFQSILLKANQRSHRSRRADSSGTNTPDQPMSPRPLDHFTENSPLGSPLVEQSEDSNHSTKSSQSVNNNTVFTLSLSAIQSSILNPNGSSLNGPNLESNAPSPVAGDSLGSATLTRSHRSVSGSSDKFFRPITPASASHECEKELISPFPSRDFPLNENECDTLCHALKGKTSYGKRRKIDGFLEESKEPVFKMENEKDGRETPFSEVTDSAPEEDDCDMDDSSPQWIISAVKDSSGSCMLQVQRN